MSRQKGRDWYDLVWYAGNHPELGLSHLEARMRQSGDYVNPKPMLWKHFQKLLLESIEQVDIAQIRKDVAPFVHDQRQLELWSHDFFVQAANKIRPV